jgi:hypothetical protein
VTELSFPVEGIERLVTGLAAIGFAFENAEIELLPRGLRRLPAHWAANHLDPILILIVIF